MEKGSGEEEAVHPIQHPSMTGNQGPRILHLRTSLQHGLREISQLAQDREPDGNENTESHVHPGNEKMGIDQGHQDRSHNGAAQSFITFIGTDLGIELVFSEERTTEKSKNISSPDRYNQKKDPNPSFSHVPNERDMRKKKPDIENSKDENAHTGDGRWKVLGNNQEEQREQDEEKNEEG